MSTDTTEINNQTTFSLNVEVGNSAYKSDLTVVEAGGKYEISVNSNATYQEYVMGPVNNDVLEKLVVNSDDLCDNKVIIIKEEDGKLQVHKESRVTEPMVSSTSTSTSSNPAAIFVKKLAGSWLWAWIMSKFTSKTKRM